MIIGFERTFRFFFQRYKLKSTALFFGGILLVLIGWPIIGMIIEFYGFFLLFGGFIPIVINFLRRLPIIGSILLLPGLRQVIDFFSNILNILSVFFRFRLRTNYLRVDQWCNLISTVCFEMVEKEKERRRFCFF
jgi:hypothetical protein